jgi:hypothetical protein
MTLLCLQDSEFSSLAKWSFFLCETLAEWGHLNTDGALRDFYLATAEKPAAGQRRERRLTVQKPQGLGKCGLFTAVPQFGQCEQVEGRTWHFEGWAFFRLCES